MTCRSSDGAFLVEFVGGPLDGEGVTLDAVCSCCGEVAGVGTIAEAAHGHRWLGYRITRFEGWRAWAEFEHEQEMTLDDVLGGYAA